MLSYINERDIRGWPETPKYWELTGKRKETFRFLCFNSPELFFYLLGFGLGLGLGLGSGLGIGLGIGLGFGLGIGLLIELGLEQ